MKPLLTLLLSVAAVSAVPIQVTYTDAANTGFFDPASRTPAGANPGTTLGQQRRIAFEYAVSRWASQISGTIPIRVRAGWSSTSPVGSRITLASASPVNFFRNAEQVSGLPRDNTFFPSALSDQVTGVDLVASGTSDDISVDCNTYVDDVSGDGFTWDYDLNNAGGTGASFVGVILHEIGHGLGFISGMGADGTYWPGQPLIWDAFMTDGSGTFLSGMSAAERAALRTSNNLFSDAPVTRVFNNGNPARLHAPTTFQDGSSLHHYDETTYSTTSSPNELMTPTVSFPTQMFGPLVTSALRDMGYTMADTQAPAVTIASPVAGKTYTSAALAAAWVSGTTSDNAAGGSSNAVGLLRTKIALFSQGQGKWYRWDTSAFHSATFDYDLHTQTAAIENLLPVTTGTHAWLSFLPAGLADGSYEVHATSVDQNDNGSEFAVSTFTIDNAAPTAVIEPWADNDTIFNLDGFRVFAPDAVTVDVKISRSDGSQLWYWTGTNWSTTSFTLTTSANGGRWMVNAALPTRANWPTGQSLSLMAVATDAASNVTNAQIDVSRTAADTTLPVASVQSPSNGAVLTVPSLPSLQGSAGDPESGISSVTLTVSRFLSGGGVEFWSGTGWSASPANLPVIYDSFSGAWTAPAGWALPSGASLPNGGYTIQATATNRESPAGTTGASSTFTVDYHPTYTWTGATMRDSNWNNDSSSWGVAENWSPYGVPDVNDIAVIANGDTVTSTVSRSVYGLKLLSGFLNFTNGAGPSGTVTTTHASEWGAATLHGAWVNEGTLLLSGTAERGLWVNSTLTNSGTVTHAGGVIIGRESCTITNSAAGTWISAASGDLFNNYNYGNHFINQGILRQAAAAESELNDWYFSLGGEIQKQGAVLGIRADGTLSPAMTLTGAGIFRIASGTVTVNSSFSNSGGPFQMTGGTLSAASPTTLNGPFSWSGGAWQGNLTLAAGSTLSLDGPTQLNNSAIFNNAGTVTWATDSPLVGRQEVRVNNTGIWRLEGTGDAFVNYNYGNVFNNEGLLEKTGANTAQLANWYYLLPGDTRSTTGVLNVYADWSWPAGGTFSGTGTIQFTGGTCSLGGEVTSTVATLRMTGGTLNGAAAAKIQGNWIWTGGAMGGSFENPAGRTLTFDGSSQLNLGAAMVNKGTVVWQGTSPLVGRESVAVTNAAGATWEIAAAGTPFANYNYGNSFTNYGLFTRTAPSGEVHVHSWTYYQHGVFHATAGDTRIGSPLLLKEGCSFTGAGTFSLLDQTWLQGASTFTANTLAYGAIHGEVAGAIHGTLQWAAGTFYGIVNVASGGTLRITTAADRSLWTGGLIDCSGGIVWEEGGIQGRENATIRIRSGASFAIASAATMSNYNYNNHVVIDDGGTLTKTSAGSSFIHWAFDNDGSAAANAGLLSLHGGGTGDGAFSGTSGGILRFADGGHVLETGATTSGGVEITGGSLLASGAAGGRIDAKGGTLGSSGTGEFSFAGVSTWTGGTFLGQLSVPTGASIVTSGPDAKWIWVLSTLNVSGLLEWQGGHPFLGRENSTIDVKSGGTFRATADGDLFGNYNGGNRLLMAGTLEKTAGSGSTLIDEWWVEGAGIVRPVTGQLDFNAGVAFNGGTTYEGAGRTRFIGNNLYARGTATIATGTTVEFAGAWIHGHADGTAAFQGGAIEWSSGVINGLVTLNSATGATGGADKWIWVGSELRNAGSMTLGGIGWLLGRENSRLVNLPGATMTCPGTSSFGNYNEGNRLVNEGLLQIGAPVGRHTMHWTFQQAATGTLAIEIGGTNATTPDFDILQVFRTAELAGTLSVTKVNGYLPAEDTTFTFLSGSPVTGSFATVQAPGFSVEYSAGSVQLRAGNTGLGYEDWADDHQLAGADRASDADPDLDGVENFLEYAFNTDPTAPSAYPASSSIVTIASQKWVVVKYRRWQDRIDAGLGYHPERSENLGSWNAAGLVDEADPEAPVVAGSEARRCRIPFGTGKNFLRLRAE